ncbi:MAG: helix-turn-helix domain-containing protein [Sneathiella sp.]|uniref:TetR/AcrR family transcriptional regulator n=1 Tax=Sneathiella sp. TaxID=1964365 RepID=UPI003000FF11
MRERLARQKDLKEFKRQKFLFAARTCISKNGLAGTSMRAIAQGSGYSLGAVYAYFSSKEDIYAALLTSSLIELLRFIRSELQQKTTGSQKTRHAFIAFLQYFLASEEEQELLFSFYARRNGSKHDVSEATLHQLNNRFLSVLGFLANTVHQNGKLAADDAQSETLQAVTFLLGILQLSSSGQLLLIGQSPEEMVDQYLDQMLLRCDR